MSEDSKVVLALQEPVPEGARPKEPGRKSKPWKTDPTILQRLETVATLMIRGARLWQIAETMNYSLTAAHNDAKRVRQLWVESVGGKLDLIRSQSIEHYRYIQSRAWAQYEDKKNPALFATILEAEKQINHLYGLDVMRLKISGDKKNPIALSHDLVLSEEQQEVVNNLTRIITGTAKAS